MTDQPATIIALTDDAGELRAFRSIEDAAAWLYDAQPDHPSYGGAWVIGLGDRITTDDAGTALDDALADLAAEASQADHEADERAMLRPGAFA